MKNFLYSCLGKSDKMYVDMMEMFKTESDTYESLYGLKDTLKPKEREMIDFMLTCYENSGSTPDVLLLVSQFPDVEKDFTSGNLVDYPSVDGLRTYMFQIIDGRVKNYIHETMELLNTKVKANGITTEIAEEFERLENLSNRNKVQDISIRIDGASVYAEKESKPIGMPTGIKAIDDRIGGMSEGTVTTIAGFTSHYKTTFAMNIADIGSYDYGYNIAYISLETPKEDMHWNHLSCHSFRTEFPDFSFVSHDRMRKCLLTDNEKDFIFGQVEPSLDSMTIDVNGEERRRGMIIILDESDFKSFTFGEILAVLTKVDDKIKQATNGKSHLDAVIVDYIQLCKFSGSGITSDANGQINSYVTFFRRLAQSFRKDVDANGNEVVRQLIMILLSQINRENWRRAKNNEGRYDITCLADANELERGSYRVITTYTTEDMKARKTAQVQILKNRTGPTMYDPYTVYADGEAYVFLDEESMGQMVGGISGANGQANIEAAFSGIDDSDLSMLGL